MLALSLGFRSGRETAGPRGLVLFSWRSRSTRPQNWPSTPFSLLWAWPPPSRIGPPFWPRRCHESCGNFADLKPGSMPPSRLESPLAAVSLDAVPFSFMGTEILSSPFGGEFSRRRVEPAAGVQPSEPLVVLQKKFFRARDRPMACRRDAAGGPSKTNQPSLRVDVVRRAGLDQRIRCGALVEPQRTVFNRRRK